MLRLTETQTNKQTYKQIIKHYVIGRGADMCEHRAEGTWTHSASYTRCFHLHSVVIQLLHKVPFKLVLNSYLQHGLAELSS